MTMWFRQYCKEKEKQKRTKKREKRNQREMIGSGTSDNGTSEGETSGWDTSEEETNAEPANQMESTSMVESSSRENVALETAANRPPKPWSPLPSKLIIYVNVRSDGECEPLRNVYMFNHKLEIAFFFFIFRRISSIVFKFLER